MEKKLKVTLALEPTIYRGIEPGQRGGYCRLIPQYCRSSHDGIGFFSWVGVRLVKPIKVVK